MLTGFDLTPEAATIRAALTGHAPHPARGEHGVVRCLCDAVLGTDEDARTFGVEGLANVHRAQLAAEALAARTVEVEVDVHVVGPVARQVPRALPAAPTPAQIGPAPTTSASEVMTVEAAEAVYDLLVKHAGAGRQWRSTFVRWQTSRYLREFYFVGDLGAGGSFWRSPDPANPHWHVACFASHLTPERSTVIDTTNAALDALHARLTGASQPVLAA